MTPDAFRSLTLLLPADSLLPTVVGHWTRRPDGKILAEYTREQYEIARHVFDQIMAGRESWRQPRLLAHQENEWSHV
jgi:hypothetical protein